MWQVRCTLPQAPGLVVLDERLTVELASLTSPGWLADLGGIVETPPASVLVVAGQVLRSGRPAESRVRAHSGRWVILHGSPVTHRDGGRRHVSVVLEAAQPTHLTSLLMLAYGMTSREQEVARLVLRGESTGAVAR